MQKKSFKLRSITKIRNNIMNMINSNNEIKRLMYYMTNTPLDNKGIDNAGKIVSQPDVIIDFINNQAEQRIYPVDFTNEILNVEKVQVFVHRYTSSLEDSIAGNILIIDIITPIDYFVLKGQNTDRNMEIACLIMDMLDQEYIGGIGEAICIQAKEGRLSNGSNYEILSLSIKVKTMNKKIK